MTYEEDIKIIDRVLAGDTAAYSRIIEKYSNMIFKYVYSQFNNWDEAEDVTQDIFIVVMEALGSFRQESKFSTWMYSVMVNYCKNYLKKSRRMKSVSLNIVKNGDEFEIPLPDERQNPEEEIIRNDSLQIVKEEIDKLPEKYRSILVLRDIQGASYNEISDVFDINLSNVKVRIHRGRELLKNRLYERGLI